MNGVAERLLKALRWLMVATVGAYLVLAAIGTWAWIESQNQKAEIERVAVSTQSALCTLRGDLERRVEDARQFLEDNPDGIPGISSEQIQQSIDNQEQTILALASLNCDE